MSVFFLFHMEISRLFYMILSVLLYVILQDVESTVQDVETRGNSVNLTAYSY